MSRTSLRSISLNGYRNSVRSTLVSVLAGTAALAGVAYLLPAHRLVYVPSSGGWLDLSQPGEASFHSLFHDGGGLPLFAMVCVAIAALLVRKSGLGTGMFTGALAAGGAVLAVMPLIFVHMFSRYESAIGDATFAIGLLGTFFVGCALFIAEPILYVLERRRIEQVTRPSPLPRATALA
jgi:hypothetical protein